MYYWTRISSYCAWSISLCRHPCTGPCNCPPPTWYWTRLSHLLQPLPQPHVWYAWKTSFPVQDACFQQARPGVRTYTTENAWGNFLLTRQASTRSRAPSVGKRALTLRLGCWPITFYNVASYDPLGPGCTFTYETLSPHRPMTISCVRCPYECASLSRDLS
jgi:hypothetical protein